MEMTEPRKNCIRFFAIVAFLFATLVGCSKNDGDETEPEPTDPNSGLPPVETSPPNTNYSPAFEGQTRINGVRTSTAYQVSIITSALNAPWGITSLPDG